MKFFHRKSKTESPDVALSKPASSKPESQKPAPQPTSGTKNTSPESKPVLKPTADAEDAADSLSLKPEESIDGSVDQLVASEDGSEDGDNARRTSIDMKALEVAEKSKLQKHKTQTRYLIRSLEDEDEETKKNTEINSLLYATGNDTVDMYKLQNSSSDLLGRLYYDDFDSDSTPTTALTPVNSGEGTVPTNEYILDRIKYSNRSTSSSVSESFSPERLAILSPRHPGSKLKRGITFDASTNNHHSTITLKLKHPHFRFRRNNKTYLVGFAGDLTSYKAIEWLFDEMIVHGDTIIVLHVLDDKAYLAVDRQKAQLIMNQIELLNARDRKVSITLELALGKPMRLLKTAIDEYEPQIMVIGSKHYDESSGEIHHRRGFMAKQSMSKHFLECALVPVIIIKSTYVHEDLLVNPIETETYFQDWLKEIDISGTYQKEKKRLSRFLSPSSSKTDLNSLRPTHSAKDSYLRPSTSRDNLFQLELELRGRDLLPTNSRLSSRSRSESRQRSSSRQKPTFSIFHH